MKIFTNVMMAGFMAVAGLAFFANAARADLPVEKLVVVSSKDGTKHSFEVEIAATYVDREVGLMYRTEMAPNHGMLFEMDKNEVTNFWMKNTLIPLDMLFVAPDGTIKTIHANAIPKDLTALSSEIPVTGVIELNGGRAAALGIAVGDKVVHPFFGSDKK
jgi:uncharacterized membrane protein (UPF0127 family)